MLSSLLRPKRTRTRATKPHRPANQELPPFGQPRNDNDGYFPRAADPQHSGSASEDDTDADESVVEDGETEEDEDGPGEMTPLLPIFSAAHLDAIPVYNLTHAIRSLIVPRCETTLTWDQLRSPQISQFLVKPIQQQIRESHFTRATLYALLANCLQFYKEGQSSPGNVGVCKTRALISELLAMRLLKEFSTRELIDCLAYDFDPLNGINPPQPSPAMSRLQKVTPQEPMPRQAIARTSTLEVSIRAQAKHFLAHPLVVQHLEAVWAGNIVFHSAADSLHRYPEKPAVNHNRHYGATHTASDPLVRGRRRSIRYQGEIIRRSVTLYNPGDASIFKLSRLRVPRYRQLFSTLSYAIMLALFISILVERSLDITMLEFLFWMWSAGFMLDEIVGFSEQGFGLYIISVWNAFDLGILVMFFIYYLLRLYGIIIAENHKRKIAGMAYDVLASTAILLFPRLFSVLDHYRYFSQLLIAFRMMAQDLVAILILIAIACSGFFVAFSLSFGDNDFGGPSGVVYALFQIIMGFTPAAWIVWPQYNLLGKALLTMFLIICHFLVVTILITVLTNSFMAIVQNANEEHCFLFAANTISMVKSDALFSYIAPSNILGWICSPLRYIIPFRQFVKVNRTLIKLTHFPILFVIFAYERLCLGHYAWEPMETVGRRQGRVPAFSLGRAGNEVFSPGPRVREPSIRTFRKDQALEEVFRHPFSGDTTGRKPEYSVTDQHSNVVDRWMNGLGNDGEASSPMEQPRSILEQLETRRPPVRRAMTSQGLVSKRKPCSNGTRSILSDPADRPAKPNRPRPLPIDEGEEGVEGAGNAAFTNHGLRADDADDEKMTSAIDEEESGEHTSSQQDISDEENASSMQEGDSLTPTTATQAQPSPFSGSIPAAARKRLLDSVSRPASPGVTGASPRKHGRHGSTNTIVFKPDSSHHASSSPSPSRLRPKTGLQSRPKSGDLGGSRGEFVPRLTARRTSNMAVPRPARPNLPNRDAYKSAPNITRFLDLASRTNRRMPSFDAIALDLASDIGDNRVVAGGAGLGDLFEDDVHYIAPRQPVAGSFQTQMDHAARTQAQRRIQQRGRKESGPDDSAMMGRMVLARMNTIEEGFKDILKEVKEWRNVSSRGGSANASATDDLAGPVGASVAGRRLARRMEKRNAAANSRASGSGAATVVGSGSRPRSLRKAEEVVGAGAQQQGDANNGFVEQGNESGPLLKGKGGAVSLQPSPLAREATSSSM